MRSLHDPTTHLDLSRRTSGRWAPALLALCALACGRAHGIEEDEPSIDRELVAGDVEELEARVGRSFVTAALSPDAVVLAWQNLPDGVGGGDGRLRAALLDPTTRAVSPLDDARPADPHRWLTLSAGAAGPDEDRRAMIAWAIDDGLAFTIYDTRGVLGRGELATPSASGAAMIAGTERGFLVLTTERGEGGGYAPVRIELDLDGRELARTVLGAWSEEQLLAWWSAPALATAPDGRHAVGWARQTYTDGAWVEAYEIQRYSSDGAPLGAPLTVTDGSARVLLALDDGADIIAARVGYESSTLTRLSWGASEALELALDPSLGDIRGLATFGRRVAIAAVEEHYDEDFEGCGPPPVSASELRVVSIDAAAPSTIEVARSDGPEAFESPTLTAGDTGGLTLLWSRAGALQLAALE